MILLVLEAGVLLPVGVEPNPSLFCGVCTSHENLVTGLPDRASLPSAAPGRNSSMGWGAASGTFPPCLLLASLSVPKAGVEIE